MIYNTIIRIHKFFNINIATIAAKNIGVCTHVVLLQA